MRLRDVSLDVVVNAVFVVYGLLAPFYWLVDPHAAAAVMKWSLLLGAASSAAALVISSLGDARRSACEIQQAPYVTYGVAAVGKQGMVTSPITQVPCTWARLDIAYSSGDDTELVYQETHGDEFDLVSADGARVRVRPASAKRLDLDVREALYGWGKGRSALEALVSERGILGLETRRIQCSEQSIRVGDPLCLRSSGPGPSGDVWLTDKSDAQLLTEVRRVLATQLLFAFLGYVVPGVAFSFAPPEVSYKISVAFMFLISVTGIGVTLDRMKRSTA